MQEDKIYRLFSPCIAVRGWRRSLIADLNRHQSFYIPNDLVKVLDYGYSRPWKDVVHHFGEENREALESYYDYLNRNELIFELDCHERGLFPKFSLDWDFPSLCSNAILDWNENSAYNMVAAIQRLSEINCCHLQLRFFSDIGIEKVKELLSVCQELDFNTIQLAFRFDASAEQDYEPLFDMCWKLAKVEVFSAPYDRIVPKMGNLCLLAFYQSKSLEVKQCGCVSKDYFVTETNHFTEAQHHNTCLNRKICIDANGDIRNCPAMKKSYGNIRDTTLKEAIEKPCFQDCWTISKDQIDVCKDCEFRYMCTDCRAFIKDPENPYSQPAKCTYNPYICLWEGQDGYVPVEECGMYNRETGFVPDKKKIAELNRRVWEEAAND